MAKKIKKLNIGVSGDKGSFSEEAGILYSAGLGAGAKILYLIDMEGVLSALNSGVINLGIFPVVNSRGGLVHPAFKAMGKYRFNMIDEIWLDVKQCLISKRSIKKADIKGIASHSQSLAQCERYLQKNFPGVKLIEWEDTAKAARDLKEGKLKNDIAVIAPARCADIYGLKILEANIQDAHPNLTTFIVVKK
jgi:prephenate dehydratase